MEDTIECLRSQRDLLGDVLGRLLVAIGVTRADAPLTGPELLLAAETTTMGLALAETYARDPEFYTGTFCTACRAYFPVGPAGEFRRDDASGDKVGA